MLHEIKHCNNTSLRNYTRMLPLFLPYNEPHLCNDYKFMISEYNNRLCFLNQVDLDTDLLDNMVLHQVVIQQIKKPRSVGPHKSRLKTTMYKKKLCIKNKKFRSASTQLRRGSEGPNRNEESSYSTIVSANTHTQLTSTSTPLKDLSLQYLHKAVITILCLCRLYEGISTVVYQLYTLQVSLQMSLHEYIIHHLYKGVFMIEHLMMSLLPFLQSEFI